MEYIRLKNPTDIQFARIAPMARVSGTTLPSGFKVPAAPEGEEWVVFGTSIVLVSLSPISANLPD